MVDLILRILRKLIDPNITMNDQKWPKFFVPKDAQCSETYEKIILRFYCDFYDLKPHTLHWGFCPQALSAFELNPPSQLVIGNWYYWLTFLHQVRKHL